MKNSILKKTVLALITILFLSTISFGQSDKREDRKEPPTFKQLLKEMDKNEDGKLSEKEIEGPLKENFTKVDTNKDGFITEKEFKKAPKPKRPQGTRPQGGRK